MVSYYCHLFRFRMSFILICLIALSWSVDLSVQMETGSPADRQAKQIKVGIRTYNELFCYQSVLTIILVQQLLKRSEANDDYAGYATWGDTVRVSIK